MGASELNSLVRVGTCVVACVVLSACPKFDTADSDEAARGGDPPSLKCAPFDGAYRFTYAHRSGTCGPQEEELQRFDDGELASSATHRCEGGGTTMVSPCELELDRTCTVIDPISGTPLGRSHVLGSLSQVSNDGRLAGTLRIAIVDTNGATCESSYEVTAIQLTD